MIRNLGEILGILVLHEIETMIAHDDVSAWYAPAECHRDIQRLQDEKFDDTKLLIEAMTDLNFSQVMAEAEKRGWNQKVKSKVLDRLFEKYAPPWMK